MTGRRRGLWSCVTMLVVFVTTMALSSPPAEAGEAPGWSIQPTGDNGVTPRNWYEYQLRPGQTVRDMVTVNNLTDAPLELAIYPADAYNTGDGGFAFLLKKDSNEGAGSWITLGYESITVPANSRADLPFEIKVPVDAAPGDHAAGIVTELLNPPEPDELDGKGVIIERRLAARMYIRVAGPLNPALEVTALGIVHEQPVFPPFTGKGSALIGYEVTNTGNTRLQGQSTLELNGLFGQSIKSFDAVDLPELLPGGSIVLTERVDDLPIANRVEAVVTVTAPGVETQRSKAFWSISVVEVLLILALLLSIYGIRRYRRRKRRSPQPDATPPTAAREGVPV